ncbi:glycoside hydrolase family 104 protein [uncultured Hydrogenophaga sp.]|uniref:glycoside hydrolase family 24 protein n=1 Tax=uncultured Hydrogenophaga sp. TaxID=199683 RepID=UPI00265F0189|nr:glycoside hydrolase family 104 protein [uncultured Hydrogenophaga sp.]
MRAALAIASAGLLTAGAWLLLRREQAAADAAEEAAGQGGAGLWASADDVLQGLGDSVIESAENFVETITMRLNLSAMRTVTAADVAHPNVRALLAVIRRGEGTADAKGYSRLVGGGEFIGFADHPRVVKSGTFSNGKAWRSSAAGAYQFIASTWDETARIMALPDFTPASQDRGAVGRIAARGALEDAKAGRLVVALQKIAREWASMPGSPYGQPVISEATAAAVYASAGGTVNA